MSSSESLSVSSDRGPTLIEALDVLLGLVPDHISSRYKRQIIGIYDAVEKYGSSTTSETGPIERALIEGFAREAALKEAAALCESLDDCSAWYAGERIRELTSPDLQEAAK